MAVPVLEVGEFSRNWVRQGSFVRRSIMQTLLSAWWPPNLCWEQRWPPSIEKLFISGLNQEPPKCVHQACRSDKIFSFQEASVPQQEKRK